MKSSIPALRRSISLPPIPAVPCTQWRPGPFPPPPAGLATFTPATRAVSSPSDSRSPRPVSRPSSSPRPQAAHRPLPAELQLPAPSAPAVKRAAVKRGGRSAAAIMYHSSTQKRHWTFSSEEDLARCRAEANRKFRFKAVSSGKVRGRGGGGCEEGGGGEGDGERCGLLPAGGPCASDGESCGGTGEPSASVRLALLL